MQLSMSRGSAKELHPQHDAVRTGRVSIIFREKTNKLVNFLYVAFFHAQVHVLAQSSDGARQVERRVS